MTKEEYDARKLAVEEKQAEAHRMMARANQAIADVVREGREADADARRVAAATAAEVRRENAEAHAAIANKVDQSTDMTKSLKDEIKITAGIASRAMDFLSSKQLIVGLLAGIFFTGMLLGPAAVLALTNMLRAGF